MAAKRAEQFPTLTMVVEGLDCADCARLIERTLGTLPGVTSVTALPASGAVRVTYDPTQVDPARMHAALSAVGHPPVLPEAAASRSWQADRRLLVAGLGIVTLVMLTVLGEAVGWLDRLQAVFPWPIWLSLTLIVSAPVIRDVGRAAWHRHVTAHTVMMLGLLAALALGQWVTALLVATFIRFGDMVERITTARARTAIAALAALAPRAARVEREGQEVLVPADAVQPGDIVVVRPGETIPVDGLVLSGQATVEQSALTGESVPVEAEAGMPVYAASIVRLGALRVQATAAGEGTTFGRMLRLVQEAEANRTPIQRIADRFAGVYLPVVLAVAGITLLLRHDGVAAAAVLVVACACPIALATPVAVLAAIGATARKGIVVRGGAVLEALAQADVLLLDKTGTLTTGRPSLTAVVPADGWSADTVLALAAAAERDSEHPLAEAVREAARMRGLTIERPDRFSARPGFGVVAQVAGKTVVVGREPEGSVPETLATAAASLVQAGNTLLWVNVDGQPAGVLAAADTLRGDVPLALAELRALGFREIMLLTGDHPQVAAAFAQSLGIPYRAGMLPEEKIRVVQDYQRQGRRVVMVGDGVNDAPALAQADVGVAMGVIGTPAAIEAASVALLREDWMLLPALVRLARQTRRVIWLNLGIAVAYNVLGLSLAASGMLSPALAAAAQTLPDLIVLGNSARLLRGLRPVHAVPQPGAAHCHRSQCRS